MTTPSYALWRLRRRARRAGPSEGRFSEHRAAYRDVLEAVHGLAGEAAVDDLMGWIVVEATHAGAFPAPDAVRERARELCEAAGATVPPDSPLSDD